VSELLLGLLVLARGFVNQTSRVCCFLRYEIYGSALPLDTPPDVAISLSIHSGLVSCGFDRADALHAHLDETIR
jgi:hypothetical protein